MSPRRHIARLVLGLASTGAIVSCSSDLPTSPRIALQGLTAWAPTIAIGTSPLLRSLCYPARAYSTRGCPSGGWVSISNTGGGTLNWTTTKSATWLKRSPKYGTAPSTMQLWVDGRDLLPGDYYGWIKVWATGATNSPQTIYVHVTRD
jgi:hypothetical protein